MNRLEELTDRFEGGDLTGRNETRELVQLQYDELARIGPVVAAARAYVACWRSQDDLGELSQNIKKAVDAAGEADQS